MQKPHIFTETFTLLCLLLKGSAGVLLSTNSATASHFASLQPRPQTLHLHLLSVWGPGIFWSNLEKVLNQRSHLQIRTLKMLYCPKWRKVRNCKFFLIQLVPKPRSKCQYCHACKEYYEDYLDVIVKWFSTSRLRSTGIELSATNSQLISKT